MWELKLKSGIVNFLNVFFSTDLTDSHGLILDMEIGEKLP